MLQLPITELLIFLLAFGLGLAAAIVGILQLRTQGQRYKPHLTHLISGTVLFLAVFLVFRAADCKTIPLTSLFESLLVLMLVFGLTYVMFGLFIQQVWFGSVMSWIILFLLILTALVAEPASKAHEMETRPWAIAHGLAMALGSAMILLAAAAAYIYLLGQRRLKHKEFSKVFGMVPNLQKLQNMYIFALRASFVLLGLGLFSGIGMAALPSVRQEIPVRQWITDPRILGSAGVWVLVALTLLGRHFRLWKMKTTVYLTFFALLLLLIGLASRAIFQGAHDELSPSTLSSEHSPKQAQP
jgi:ABC-type uncharacterized transport system permease subunit